MSGSGLRRLTFVTWDRTDPTGGNTYNAGLIQGFRELGVEVIVHRLSGPWPIPDPVALSALADVLVGGRYALIDGILASAAPSVLACTRSRVTVLVHMPVTADPALDPVTRDRYAVREQAALAAAETLICPSESAARDLHDRYGLDALVVTPGVAPAPVATGSTPPRLLVLGALTTLKRPLAAVEAVAALPGADLRLDLVGSQTVEPAYAAAVRAAAAADPRVTLHGVVTGDALERIWAATDLLVHPSAFETYGLAVAEAWAHGVPALVAAGTAAATAVEQSAVEQSGAGQSGAGQSGAGQSGAGQSYGPGDLPAVLLRWLGEPELRTTWRSAASVSRDRLPTWGVAAARVLAAVTRGRRQAAD